MSMLTTLLTFTASPMLTIAGPRICAYVAVASRDPQSEASLLQHCRAVLAPPAVPLRAVVLPRLPRGPAGKVLRGELPEPSWTSPLTGASCSRVLQDDDSVVMPGAGCLVYGTPSSRFRIRA